MDKQIALVLAFLSILSLFTFSGSAAKASPQTIYVPGFNDLSIQDAINSASAGDTIFVKKGTYNTYQIRIDKPLTLIGEDSQQTVVLGIYNHSFDKNVFDIWADNVTISGLTITGDSRMNGISGEYGKSNTKIIGNNIRNLTTAISLGGYENLLVSQNNLAGNKLGMYITYSSSEISGNMLSENSEIGIILYECQKVTIRQNKIIENADGLFLGRNGPFYVYENNITDNLGYGIQFGSNCNYSAHNNYIARNQMGISVSSVGLGNQIYYNNLVHNGKHVEAEIGNGDPVAWDNGFVGNFWSDYQQRYPNATEIDASGIGNTPYIIDENNTDHYPLMQQIDISVTAPTPTSSPTLSSSPSIPEFPTWVVVTFLMISALAAATIYRKKHLNASG